ncbi:MAG: GNAT family N-acetyltransferase [Candidatus Pacebacteria bacterium]|nr:GNAT family N-acetyltransferase [Candidatus Paceibacterota bacterium]
MFTYEKIKKVSESDSQTITELATTLPGFKPNPEWDYDLSSLQEVYIDSGGMIEVAKENGKIVGCIAVKRNEDDIAELKRLRVFPDYQGKGIGTNLFQDALDFCSKENFEKIIADTQKNNKKAISLLKKFGFFQVKKDEKNLYFEKRI